MSGRLLNSTLLLALSSFPAPGLLLTAALGAFGGSGWATLLVATAYGSVALGIVVLLLLGVPVLRFVASAGSEFPEPPRIGLPDAYAWSVVAASWALWPFFAAGIVRGVRDRDTRLLFLALMCVGGYALASVVSISGRNEYKFIYLGSLGLCLVSLGPITHLVTSRALGWRSAGPLAAALVLLLGCWNVALFGVGLLRGPLFGVGLLRGPLFGVGLLRGPLFADRTLSYAGRHVTAAAPAPGSVMPGTGIEYADLFAWVDALYRWATPAPRRRDTLRDIDAALPGRPKVLVFPRVLSARFDPETAGLRRVREGTVADLYVFPGTTTDGAS